MPQIPVYTAEGATQAIQYPTVFRHIQVPQATGGEAVGRTLQHFGSDLSGIADKLQHQQELVDSADLIGTYEGRLREIHSAVNSEIEDPQQRSAEFVRRARDLQRGLI